VRRTVAIVARALLPLPAGCAPLRPGAAASSLAALLVVAAPLATTTAAAATLRVTSALDHGEGTLRAAIRSANARPGSTIEIGLGAGSVIVIDRALPVIEARATRLEGRGVTLREGKACERPGGRKGCDAIAVVGPGIVVRDLRIAGFTFDAVAVRGPQAANVRVERVHAIDNGDDGVGVSSGAGPVLVSDCVLMGNGFRTKGKGLLVFDDAVATLRDSVVVANRDGVTATRGSKATLERVMVAGNYDKGVGVSGASVVAREVTIAANGRDTDEGEAAPNADGLRVGLGGSAQVSACRIAGNGDSGVVVLDTSTVSLRACIVEANRGKATVVAPSARLDQH
jgi:hypothetical protein